MGSHHVPRPGCGSAASGDSCPGVPHPLIPMFPQCPWLFCPASCFPGAARAPPHPILLPAGGGCRPCTTGLGPASEDFLIFWAVVGLVPPSPPISRPPQEQTWRVEAGPGGVWRLLPHLLRDCPLLVIMATATSGGGAKGGLTGQILLTEAPARHSETFSH